MTISNPSAAARGDLARRWDSPATLLRSPVGERGFSLPLLDGLVWHPMPGGASGNNWVVSGEELPDYSYNIGANCRDNIVLLDRGTKCRGNVVIRGSRNLAIVVGSKTAHSPVNFHFHSSDHLFFFGNGTTCNTATFEMGTDGTAIVVGEDCMFSAYIDVTTDDHHAMIDLSTGAHMNPPNDVIIEPHVWVAMHAMILKGVRVGFGSIIGARSVVTSDVPRKSAVVGAPARVTKTNVSWIRDRHAGTRALEKVAEIERYFSGDERVRGG